MKKRGLLIFLAAVLVAAIWLLGRPLLHLGIVWWRESSQPLPSTAVGTNDASRLAPNKPVDVVQIAAEPAAAEQQISELVHKAAKEGLRISISGARHAMGGHTLYPGGITLDMLSFRHISLDEKRRILTVGSGIRWAEVIPFLDQRGLAVGVMQSNNDFTVGGSLSVNCHGWQHDSPPIAGTVESFRIVTADGSIKRCSRTENQELFSLALGGYGLFGVILDADLHVVSNEFYHPESYRVKPANYARVYHELNKGRHDIGMAYGRISVAPDSFLKEGVITLLTRQNTDRSVAHTLTNEQPSPIKRLVFRGCVGSDYGKNLRWTLEKLVGESAGELLSRNQIMNEPSEWYGNRDIKSTDVLHEYFLPASRLGEFLEKIRPVFLKHRPDLLNITVRNVDTDTDTFLRYAREEVFGLVMYFHQGLDATSESAMQSLTRDLIDTSLACNGTYYLPYRPHATLTQFQQAYPQARQFFALKKRYDPSGVFENQFYLNYGKPLD